MNDIGRDPETPGYSGTASAAAVAEEIRALGGNAVADLHSVATEEGAAAVVQTALDAFGGVDILVNNAGISVAAPFDEMSSTGFSPAYRYQSPGTDLDLSGSLAPHACQGVRTHREHHLGRTRGLLPGLLAYGTSKGGLLSLTRSLAAEGAGFGIGANAVNPGAFTRMVAAQQEEDIAHVSGMRESACGESSLTPVVAFLAHETLSGDG